MTIWKNAVTLEVIQERNKNTLSEWIGIEFTKLGDDYLTATMSVDEKTKQPIGILHGGASCVLAETIGSNAANMAVDLEREYCVGLSINSNHLKAVRDGLVTATTTPIHLGRSTQVWEIKILNENNKLASIHRLTMAVMQRDIE